MKEKNYWPLAIIGVLLFGVFMVSVSITIALKNPVQDEDTYLSSKRDVDERINEIIKDQHHFLHMYKPTFSFLDSQGYAITLNDFHFPYITKPKRNKKEQQSSKEYLPNQGQLYIELAPLTQESNIPLSMRLFLASFHKANALEDLGILTESTKPFVYISDLLSLPFGRWKFILEVTYDEDNKKAYFEREIFVKAINL
ncbi:hypothetical protein [Helicobacter marmotae]|uniref:Uncharacterized protein n=1 Tax=Helicobacter marmotae TaxID=152490 RepID=A0A3D8I568_9HELI|nr:hypothetical protein [Helicobacter marmotae]RDU60293.1 hypothetical protein CQA63_03505 [Helicobacter marmotae]